MSKVLMPIHPEYVDLIMAEKKKFEYRKQCCRPDTHTMLVYATSPVCAVICEAEISEVLQNTPEVIWQLTYEYAGISKDDYFAYYAGCGKAVAYKLGKIVRYREPIQLAAFGIGHAPQLFVYVR